MRTTLSPKLVKTIYPRNPFLFNLISHSIKIYRMFPSNWFLQFACKNRKKSYKILQVFFSIQNAQVLDIYIQICIAWVLYVLLKNVSKNEKMYTNSHIVWIMHEYSHLWNNCENESTVMKIGRDFANYILIDMLNGGKHYGYSNPWKNKTQNFLLLIKAIVWKTKISNLSENFQTS